MSSGPVESKDAVIGRILWLPRFNELPPDSVKAVEQTPAVMNEAFDHPVVICSRPADNDGEYVHFHIVSASVSVLGSGAEQVQLTSFHNTSLAEKFNMKLNKQRRKVNWYLPIAPAEYHPEEAEGQFGHPHIELENGRRMSSKSFINAKDIYAIRWRLLTRYQTRGSYRLTASSIEHMNERTGRLVTYHPGDQYYPTPDSTPEPASPRPAAIPPAIPPVKTLPPVDKWTRIDVVAPFRLAGGNKAVVFVGTLSSDDNSRSQALCIIPEHNLLPQPQHEPQPTLFAALAAPFRTVGTMIGNALSSMWHGCGRRRVQSDMV